MRHCTQIVLIAFAVLILSSSAFADISLIPSTDQVNISRNDSIGLQFRLRNYGYERACIDLETEQDDSYIDTSIGDDFICLNAGESTRVTVTVRTHNAPRGLQALILNAFSDEGDAYAFVSIYVGEEPEIELVAYPSDICRGEQEYVNVLVRNNSDEFKEVRLQAENEMLLPYFERSRLNLVPFQEKYVELRLHPSPYNAEGRHYVSMYATTDYETVKKRIAVDVVECGEEERAEFSVRIDSGCFVAEKGEEERIYFKVENRLDEEQRVYFSVGGDLDARLSTYNAWLEEDEQREFYFNVFVDEEARIKDYDLTLHVWNSDHSVEKEVCIRPKKMHAIDVEIEKNDLVIRQCESAVFTVLLENLGDYSEDFELDIENDHRHIEAALSEDDLRIERRDSEKVYLSVNVLDQASEGSYSLWLEVEANGERIEKQLRFTVVEEQAVTEAPSLEIVSYASSLRMDENSEKGLSVTLRNNGEQALDGIAIDLYGLPQSISAGFERNISLLPGQEKEFELTVSAEEGTVGEYNLVLQAQAFDYSDEKPVKLVIEAIEETGETGLGVLSGLFAIGGSALLGLAALIIVVIALVLISRAFKGKPNTKKGEEIWIRG